MCLILLAEVGCAGLKGKDINSYYKLQHTTDHSHGYILLKLRDKRTNETYDIYIDYVKQHFYIILEINVLLTPYLANRYVNRYWLSFVFQVADVSLWHQGLSEDNIFGGHLFHYFQAVLR